MIEFDQCKYSQKCEISKALDSVGDYEHVKVAEIRGCVHIYTATQNILTASFSGYTSLIQKEYNGLKSDPFNGKNAITSDSIHYIIFITVICGLKMKQTTSFEISSKI